MAHPRLMLKRNEERRLRAGHLWVFSNEVDTQRTPLTDFEPGQAADVVDSRGKAVGTALVNPRSLICARLISRRPGVVPDREWLGGRLARALGLRQTIYPTPHYRLLFGEGDGLPGIVLDRFGDVLVGQLNTAGAQALRSELEAAIEQVLAPDGILWRNDAPVRELEGLAREVVAGPGRLPPTVPIEEDGLVFEIELQATQKTGWYFDQRANRARLRPLVRDGMRVLDLYSFQGAWGLMAVHAGAGSAELVDASEPAMVAAGAHARANGLAGKVRTHAADVEGFMESALAEGRRFDLVIVDPPPFARRGKDVKPALAAYRRINQQAMRLVEPGGLLVTCTCSAHVHEERFADGLLKAARHLDRELQVLARLEQGPDHPVHPAIPETRYLKGFILRVLAID